MSSFHRSTFEPLEDRKLMAVSFTVVDLDPFDGTGGAGIEGGVSNSPDINKAGDLGGKGFFSTPIIQHATIRRAVNGVVKLFDVGNLFVDESSDGKALNNVGGLAGSYTDNQGREHALYGQINKKGKAVSVALPDAKGLKGAIAYGINDANVIVGSGGNLTSSETALVWRANKRGAFAVAKLPQFKGSSPVPGLSKFSIANDVNRGGVITGMATNAGLIQRAVIWRPGKNGAYTLVDLGQLKGPAGFPGGSYAHAINDKGLAVGVSFVGTKGHATAFIPNAKGKYAPVALPFLKGSTRAEAIEVNNAGTIVGTMEVNGEDVAVMWTKGAGGKYAVTNLNKYAPANQNWEFHEATGINDAGQIVGTGVHGGSATFLLTPGKAKAVLTTAIAPAPTVNASTFSTRAINDDLLA
jgi:hypothetical protein